MRADSAHPRTWLLAVLAGWAAMVWGFGLFGLGGHVAPLPIDPAHLARLPQLRPPASARIGPPEQYVQVALRPAFEPNRRPRPFYIENPGSTGDGQGFDFKLSSVLITPSLRMVILQPAQGGEALRVRMGEEVEGSAGWRLSEVQARSAIFDGPGGRRKLELQVYTGGGAAPAPVAAQTLSEADESAISALTQAVAGQGKGAPAAAAGTPASPATSVPAVPAVPAELDLSMVPERQLQQIRARIEARRAQLRQQQGTASETPSSPP